MQLERRAVRLVGLSSELVQDGLVVGEAARLSLRYVTAGRDALRKPHVAADR